ncbi:MAG TPA: tetratricopeptide repeat protein, partial [Blastocatellia bacterium]|nr:tetratricopeptide repeat protein [Blastocatellia bacterium]
MLHKETFIASIDRLALVIFLTVGLCVSALAQDPTGRPTGTKGKPTTGKSKPTTKESTPVTVMLTVLTDPGGSTVLVNGEERGVTNSEGKIQFDKLPLGHYTIEVRKEGYNAKLRGFDAGSEAPTLVFKLEPKLDDYIRDFNSLVGTGKLIGPESPNALELVNKLAATYGDRPEVTTLKSVLAAKLVEGVPPLIAQTVTNWRAVTRDQIGRALDATASSLALKKDDARTQAEAAYLRGAIALRDWQTGSAKGEAGAQGNGSVATAPDAARAEFENSLKLDESLTATRYQLGIVMLASGDASGAETTLIKVTQSEPKWASAYTALGSTYYAEGRYKESVDAYQKAIAIEPGNAGAVAGLGLARVLKGDKDGVKDIERAM